MVEKLFRLCTLALVVVALIIGVQIITNNMSSAACRASAQH
jgi:hypothetical protein